MNLIGDILEPYAALERNVRALMTRLFSGTCALCTTCCCRADICEEAAESAFLSRLLKQQGLGADDMDERFGWLDLDGCSLKYGRPPVCYAYFCDELLARLPDDDARFTATVLGKLMYHIGANAQGELHLVELKGDMALENVDTEITVQRLTEAQSAFNVIEEFFLTGRLSHSDRETLSLITTEEP